MAAPPDEAADGWFHERARAEGWPHRGARPGPPDPRGYGSGSRRAFDRGCRLCRRRSRPV